MTDFFTLGNINELVLQGHSYISGIAIKIIEDKNNIGSSKLENHFYSFLDLLEVIEERKDLETNDDKLQQLVLRLSGYVENECVYYNGKYLDIDNPMYSGSVIVDTSDLVTQEQLADAIAGITGSNQKTVIDIEDNSEPLSIDWNNDLVPNSTVTYAVKHGKKGYVCNYAKWFNGTSYEKNDGFTMDDTYDINSNLLTVVISTSDIPFRFIIL